MRNVYRPDALVQAWFDLLPAPQAATARALLDAVMAAQPHLLPVVKWGNLVLLHAGQQSLAIAPYRKHAHLQIFNSEGIDREFPNLGGSGRGLRHLRQRLNEPVDAELVAAIVHAATQAQPAGQPS
jgi:hypothetical protein